mmetsp:Transcript_10559/g.25750  ORF Transcript_10559/g.25750 Transcript_10559/m.25750 type:complete len:108 (+) Transcript_10559:158-481(+)
MAFNRTTATQSRITVCADCDCLLRSDSTSGIRKSSPDSTCDFFKNSVACDFLLFFYLLLVLQLCRARWPAVYAELTDFAPEIHSVLIQDGCRTTHQDSQIILQLGAF